MIQAFIKKGSFQDSVSLMLISRQLSGSEGVEEVSVMMGTPANKALLDATGLWHPMFDDATPNDICVAVRAKETNEQQDVLAMISEQLEKVLAEISQASQTGARLPKARRWKTALEKQPDSNLALISVAGEYAASVAHDALDNGLNVMMFSDNVPAQEERELKLRAKQKNLIVMGPDCGTSIIAGAPLAFANVIPNGGIGIIGASGTGIQELASQIALSNQGISHAIGLGGRDLSEEIGGISALTALQMFEHDMSTRVIAFVSKPPSPAIEQRVLTAMKAQSKPVVALFLGTRRAQARDENVFFANSIAEAGRLSAMLANVQDIKRVLPSVQGTKILGLYAGGTLAAEAALLLAENQSLTTDATHDKGVMLNDAGHLIIDLGDDFYTRGRPHPMIDPTTRNLEIQNRLANEDIGVLLLDVVIGFGATPDPASQLIEAIQHIREQREKPINVIATVTGTDQDPQSRTQQIQLLLEGNISVVNSLEEAVLLAESLISQESLQVQDLQDSLFDGVKVINIGLKSFAEDLQATSTPVVHYQWSPIAGGNPELSRLLKQMQ